jgi:8-oxo-dGTP pyrophosphatase MutT (NUDIX family)
VNSRGKNIKSKWPDEIKRLAERLSAELPGLKAQLMAAPPFREGSFSVADIEGARQASVLWLMYPGVGDGVEGVLILRAKYDGVHSMQVGLPGGERDAVDVDDLGAALRECEEEIGVTVGRGDVVGALSPLYIPPSNFLVRPYVAWLREKPEFTLDESEVEGLLFLSVEDLCSEEFWSTYKVKNIRVPGFVLDGNVVWGATAMMIYELKVCCNGIFNNTFAK